MSCNYPATGRMSPSGAMTYYGHLQKAAGKIPRLPPNYREFPLPCGKCTGCKLERSRQWAVRLMHEAQLHKKTSFITLTYRDKDLPSTRPTSSRTRRRPVARPRSLETGLLQIPIPRTDEAPAHEDRKREESLSPRDLRGFTHRLNSEVRRRSGKGVKYYACGEYGDRKKRPHYHIAVYGEDFSDDRTYWKQSPSGHPLWRSSRLARLWPWGDADIGDLTFESAAYVARYILKKITGQMSEEHYKRTDERGEDYWLVPEFNRMSRRPGLAKEWFLANKNDVYPHDHVISRGNPAKPPRYYDELLKQLDESMHALIKFERETADRNPDNQHPARLEAREIVTLAKLNQHKRSLE